MKAALFFCLLHVLAPLPVSAAEAEYDVVVSGATAPGIIAAVRAAREGLKVALVARGQHLGGSLVLTEHHTFGRQVAPKPVALGSYGTDTHEIRRIVKNGVVAREGKTATGRGGAPPYPIGYDAIVPRRSECENLFVTFALSASHTAFSSIRMEPVFMCSSQSAATAAVLAIEANQAVQDLDYEAIKTRLLHDKQILTWPTR